MEFQESIKTPANVIWLVESIDCLATATIDNQYPRVGSLARVGNLPSISLS
jgi:hypothetical protein